MAYLGKPSGAEKCLFELAEIGMHDDLRAFSPLATTNGFLLSNGGLAVLPMKGFHLVPIAPSAGYVYSGETVTTGFYVGGSQIRLCKPGCRLGNCQRLCRFTNAGYSDMTKYINSFSDGEIWVSDSSSARSGVKISKKLSEWNTDEVLPRGMLYSVCCLAGAGGGGGAAGLLASYDNNGGSGGVSFFISRWIRPDSGCDVVTLVLGATGKGATKGIGNDGAAGGTTYLAGRAQVTGGGRANGGSNNAPNQTSTVSYPWGTAWQSTILSANGSDTASVGTVSAGYPAPEGGTIASPTRWGGAAGSGAGYGAGGDGNPSSITIWY
jgi:hypothetical protein